MTYTRKTADSFEVQKLYNGEWEIFDIAFSRRIAENIMVQCREKDSDFAKWRVINKRVPI